ARPPRQAARAKSRRPDPRARKRSLLNAVPVRRLVERLRRARLGDEGRLDIAQRDAELVRDALDLRPFRERRRAVGRCEADQQAHDLYALAGVAQRLELAVAAI